jgi:AcrR family transcriptional regulator
MSDTKAPRRTQAQRREESSQAVLDSATRLFGERGYANTSLEDIAADCNLTIRPIYHYFGNKKALFEAVNERMEQRILHSMSAARGSVSLESAMRDSWRGYLDLCDDPAFRQIVLVDGANVLGRERWASSVVSQRALAMLQAERDQSQSDFRSELVSRVLMGAFTEAAVMVAAAEDLESAKVEAEELMVNLSMALLGGSHQ